MDITTGLKRLLCVQGATLEEIKTQYRRLSKQLHPDLNPNKDVDAFIALQQAYDFLLQNYTPPKIAPKPDGHVENFYRFIDPNSTNIVCDLAVPPILKSDAYIYFMQGTNEFRVLLRKGTVIPTTISITNLRAPLTIKVINHIDMKV